MFDYSDQIRVTVVQEVHQKTSESAYFERELVGEAWAVQSRHPWNGFADLVAVAVGRGFGCSRARHETGILPTYKSLMGEERTLG